MKYRLSKEAAMEELFRVTAFEPTNDAAEREEVMEILDRVVETAREELNPIEEEAIRSARAGQHLFLGDGMGPCLRCLLSSPDAGQGCIESQREKYRRARAALSLRDEALGVAREALSYYARANYRRAGIALSEMDRLLAGEKGKGE